MRILRDIKVEREKKRLKEPLEPRPHDAVGAIVRDYGLEEDFIAGLKSAREREPEPAYDRIRRKPGPGPGPFVLLGRREYDIAREILKAVKSPYLAFAASPEEILFAGPLFRLNPEIGDDVLAALHFETLFSMEAARVELERLKREKGAETRQQSREIAGRMETLGTFVERAEHAARSGRS